jgi:integrase
MSQASATDKNSMPEWQWPIDLAAYDRSWQLTDAERAEIALLAARPAGCGADTWVGGAWPERSVRALDRLLAPLAAVSQLGAERCAPATLQVRYTGALWAFLLEMKRRGTAYWAWPTDMWLEFVASGQKQFDARCGWGGQPKRKRYPGTRQCVMLAAYLFGSVPDPRSYGQAVRRGELAALVFGQDRMTMARARVLQPLQTLGYSNDLVPGIACALYDVLLLNHHPNLERITFEHISWVYETSLRSGQHLVALLSRVLESLQILERSIPQRQPGRFPTLPKADGSLSPEWERWCQIWRELTTVAPRTRESNYAILLMVGRWLKQTHPEITSPAQWTATIASEFVAAVSQMTVGQYVGERSYLQRRAETALGQPLKPRTIAGYLATTRCFFTDLQASGKIPLRFHPQRYLVPPPSIRRKIGPAPRVIDRAMWAKLIWAGQHLQREDLPSTVYPLELIRALAAVWLFTGLRSDEIVRLPVGCCTWPATDIRDPETGQHIAKERVCYLQVPVNKTGPAFSKPVAPYVGTMIAAWEQLRPPQKRQLDRKSAEWVAYLFSVRGKRLGRHYLNNVLIPLLCRKAGIPENDPRGRITSHRARATIATFLSNCNNPMSIWQLMRWLGHRSAQTTRNYVDVDMTKLTLKIAEGSALQQQLATIPVLIDQDAVVNGAAGQGEAWKYFDLGHGYCKLPEWAACRHRMACAKCDFYEPKQSTRMQLLEANGNLTRMLEFVTLDDDERGLVEQGIGLNQALLARLADEPTPAGPTPRQIEATASRGVSNVTSTVTLIQPE